MRPHLQAVVGPLEEQVLNLLVLLGVPLLAHVVPQDGLVQAVLAGGRLEQLLLVRVLGHQPVHLHVLGLTDPEKGKGFTDSGLFESARASLCERQDEVLIMQVQF
jgi:hypothetical protein